MFITICVIENVIIIYFSILRTKDHHAIHYFSLFLMPIMFFNVIYCNIFQPQVIHQICNIVKLHTSPISTRTSFQWHFQVYIAKLKHPIIVFKSSHQPSSNISQVHFHLALISPPGPQMLLVKARLESYTLHSAACLSIKCWSANSNRRKSPWKLKQVFSERVDELWRTTVQWLNMRVFVHEFYE